MIAWLPGMTFIEEDAPSATTSKERGRPGYVKEECVGRDGVLLFDVIPGPPQAEPGIQWLGCGRLALCVVHVDGARIGGAPVWIPARPFGPSGMTSKSKGCPVRDDEKYGVRRPG